MASSFPPIPQNTRMDGAHRVRHGLKLVAQAEDGVAAHLVGLGDGQAAAVAAAPGDLAVVEPDVAHEVAAIEDVFRAGVEDEDAPGNAEAALQLQVEAVVERAAQGVDAGEIVDAAALRERVDEVEGRVGAAAGSRVAQVELDSLPQADVAERGGRHGSVEVAVAANAVEGAIGGLGAGGGEQQLRAAAPVRAQSQLQAARLGRSGAGQWQPDKSLAQSIDHVR